MIESRDIKLHTWTCDVPGCAALEEVVEFPGPTNWTIAPLSASIGLVLCPKHADYSPIIKTVVLALERLQAEDRATT